jgi:hypothetical protein
MPTYDLRKVYIGALHLFCFFSTLYSIKILVLCTLFEKTQRDSVPRYL